MPQLSWWKRALMASVVLVPVLAAMTGQPRPGLSAEAVEPVPQAAGGTTFRYFGSKSCAECHSATKERPTSFTYAADFIRLNEYPTWANEDKHSLAFVRLSSQRGKNMASRLGLDVTRRESGCLGCHSAGTAETSLRRQGNQFDPNEGVSCENCHGPYSGWGLDHTQVEFRERDAKQRAEMGMIDVRVPEIQAGQCLSCHIGDVGQGKVVTHDMYAAGHPPLPSIEVATFCESIPRHWWLLGEKDIKIRKAARFREGDRERTRLAIVGAAVALKASMKLIADEAKAPGNTSVPGLGWPDYARFDCWSCHHDLKRESWRQTRGFDGPPGRPPIGEWPLAIVELGIERLAVDDHTAGALVAELKGHQKTILDLAYARPYGRKAPLAKAAEEYAAWTNVLIGRLASARYDDAVALRILRKLVARAEGSTPDYDAARHMAWTARILVEDAGTKLPDRSRINPILKQLGEGLKLDLPSGRKVEIEDDLPRALLIIGDYEPARFREQMQALAALLPKE